MPASKNPVGGAKQGLKLPLQKTIAKASQKKKTPPKTPPVVPNSAVAQIARAQKGRESSRRRSRPWTRHGRVSRARDAR